MTFSYLKSGDCIGIAASSSAFSEEDFLIGVQVLEGLGYPTRYAPDIFTRDLILPVGLAGNDERRLSELVALLIDPQVKAILFARGGWGVQRILSSLLSKFPHGMIPKKPIIGYSDLTTLALFLTTHDSDYPFFYGPVVAKDLAPTMTPASRDSLKSALEGSFFNREILLEGAEALLQGEGVAPISGGCLTLIATTSGTPYGLSFANKILFIEEVNEAPYAIDRLLVHLKETGRLNGIRGLICGRFTNCGDPQAVRAIIHHHVAPLSIPIVWNAPYGHGGSPWTLPFNVSCRLRAGEKNTLFFESN